MQYTGLKDATKWCDLSKQEQDDWIRLGKTATQWEGREIYEGDILRGLWGEQRNEKRQEVVGPVQFREGAFVWHTWLKIFHNFTGRHPLHWREDFPTGQREYRACEEIEVVGNIYENPELLE